MLFPCHSQAMPLLNGLNDLNAWNHLNGFYPLFETILLPSLQNRLAHRIQRLSHLAAKVLLDGQIEHELGRDAFRGRRRLQGARDAARDYVHIRRGLKTSRECPEHLVRIFDVDVFIHHDDVLPFAASRVE